MKRIFLFLFMFIVLLFISMEGAIPAEERAALIALYNATDGDNWYDNSGWKTPPLDTDGFAMPGTEKNWYGITVKEDHVTEISLFSLNLNGTIPPELGNLSSLEYLNLNSNQLSGSIPMELLGLSHLERFDLAFNQLSGSIPSELENLSNLHFLLLDFNQFSGSIPPELGNLIHLQYLLLSENQLSGSIPPELGNLSNLQGLSLSGNQLSGSIPSDLGNLIQLDYLYLDYNQLSGSIPPELGNFSSLKYLLLNNNQLSGSIPPELGNFSSLKYLYLSNNQLSGSIPPELGNNTELYELFLHDNQLSGSIPPELGNFYQLWILYLNNNRLGGSIPSELGNLSSLVYLRLDKNQLTGSIPSSLANLTDISSQWTNIGYNALYTNDETLRFFLNSKDSDWESTQTIAPTNVFAGALSSSSIRVSWTPIAYTEDTGGYEVYYSTTSGGPWTYAGITANKSTASYDVTGLNLGTTYYLMIKTRTDSHGANSNTVVSETSDEVFAVPSDLVLALNRTKMDFGYVIGGNVPGSQTLTISGGSVVLTWAASVDVSWLNVSPSSGTGSAVVNVSINPTGLTAGTYPGTITVSSPYATNSPQTVDVVLTVYDPDGSSEPFGEFATPLQGSTVRSSIPVTGWALDDIGVENVKIYREDEGNLVYIGDAVFVEGARPDVEQAYPGYPMNCRAGWGYMMLTNFLPNGGNGTFILHAVVTDTEGNQVTLGTKTITCDNANAVKPFGAIDAPAQGGTASGSVFRNQGWVLTPPPNAVPTNGSTINVYVDAVNLGHPTYNVYRSDIATLFPGYVNSNGAQAYFDFDTTAYENGVHIIQWTATDDAGNSDGIGSRYFTIQNSQGARSMEHGARSMEPGARGMEHGAWSMEKRVPCLEPVGMIRGYRKDVEPQTVYPDNSGMINIEINQLERMEIHLGDINSSSFYSGYQLVGDEFKSLPIGSTLDIEKGIFYWQAGHAFIGEYLFMFIAKGPNGMLIRKDIKITIHPGYDY
jgi:Leucine-rich repeat (LRR) protein